MDEIQYVHRVCTQTFWSTRQQTIFISIQKESLQIQCNFVDFSFFLTFFRTRFKGWIEIFYGYIEKNWATISTTSDPIIPILDSPKTSLGHARGNFGNLGLAELDLQLCMYVGMAGAVKDGRLIYFYFTRSIGQLEQWHYRCRVTDNRKAQSKQECIDSNGTALCA